MSHRLLDLFCGRWGWSKAFAKRGWECIGIDLVTPPEFPERCHFMQWDVLHLSVDAVKDYKPDFIVASSPCEQFSVWGMPHFHPNPKYPTMGIKLFNHTREICELSGIPYAMENVRSAQAFVGEAKHHCGPFYLWGNAVPPIMPQGIRKNMIMGESSLVNEFKWNGDREAIKAYRRKFDPTWNSSKSKERKEATAKAATIPAELANCVADYAERLLEQRSNEATALRTTHRQ